MMRKNEQEQKKTAPKITRVRRFRSESLDGETSDRVPNTTITFTITNPSPATY